MGKLRKKLASFAMDNHIKKYAELNAKHLENIADEYAIEFAYWCEWYAEREIKTYIELLKIFKKEKGL